VKSQTKLALHLHEVKGYLWITCLTQPGATCICQPGVKGHPQEQMVIHLPIVLTAWAVCYLKKC